MIPKYIEEAMNFHNSIKNPNLDQIIDVTNLTKLYIKEKIKA